MLYSALNGIPNVIKQCSYATAAHVPSGNQFFSAERKTKLRERISKTRNLRPASTKADNDPSKRASVLIPFVLVDEQPR